MRGGKATHPTPFPLRECEPLIPTRVPIVSLFLELGLFAPGVLPVCLMMAVNVMASNSHLLDSLPLVMGAQVVGRMSCLPLVRRADHRPCPVSEVCWSCLPLVVPVGAKAPATLVGVGLQNQRRLSPSVMSSSLGVTLPCRTLLLYLAWLRQSGSNLPAPAPDGLVTWCTREVARGVYEMTAKLCQLLSAGDVAQEAGLIGIDRWMLRRSYCVCVWRLTSVCGRVSAAERLMWSIVRTAPYQSDGLRVLIV